MVAINQDDKRDNDEYGFNFSTTKELRELVLEKKSHIHRLEFYNCCNGEENPVEVDRSTAVVVKAMSKWPDLFVP